MVKFIKVVKRDYLPFYLSLFSEGYKDKTLWKEFGDLDYSLSDLIVSGGYWFYPEYHMIGFRDEIINKLISNPDFFYKIKNNSLEYEKELLNSTSTTFENFCDVFKKYSLTLAFFFIFDDVIESKIRNILVEKVGVSETDEIMKYIIIPLQKNFSVLEKLSILKNSNEDHLANFKWFHSRLGLIKEYDENYINSTRKELKNNHFEENYNDEIKKVKFNIIKAKKLIGDYLVNLIQFFVYYRTQRSDIINKVIYYTKEMIQNKAEEIGFNREDLVWFTYNEIKSKAVSNEIKNKRINDYTFISNKKGYSILSGKESFDYRKINFPDKIYSNKVYGKSVYFGIVRGKVVIVKNQSDLTKVNNGSILITSMTTPDMVVAMNKAAAFVTDEGGITCHASISAREMKKPCIIGTKNATKSFKDGDLVEVDAEKGVVRKI